MTAKDLFKNKINLGNFPKLSFLSLKNKIKKSKTKKNEINFSFEKILKFNIYNTKISVKQKINFFDNIYNLLNSWIPFVNSLKLMIVQTKDKKIIKILENILKEINSWKKFSETLFKFKKIFTNFDIALVQMWEETWNLPWALEIVKNREEKAKDLRAKIIWALIYPTIIVVLAISMIVTFLIFVIPKIRKMYIDARVSLPSLTQKVIDVSNFLETNYKLILIILWVIIFIIILLKKYSKTWYYFDKFILSIPIFWNLIKKKILVVFSQTLWTLLESWVLISKALEITKKSLENRAYEKKIDEIISWVSRWEPMSKYMWIWLIKQKKEDFYFPIELAAAVKIWEETWKTDELLLKISLKYKRELDYISKNIWTAIEPIVIIFVGWIIWTIILAILMPFFNMVNVVW